MSRFSTAPSTADVAAAPVDEASGCGGGFAEADAAVSSSSIKDTTSTEPDGNDDEKSGPVSPAAAPSSSNASSIIATSYCDRAAALAPNGSKPTQSAFAWLRQLAPWATDTATQEDSRRVRKPSPGMLRSIASTRQGMWDSLWDQDDFSDKAAADESDSEKEEKDEEAEEKHEETPEMERDADNTATTDGGFTRPPLLHQAPLPLLSAGPYPSFTLGGSPATYSTSKSGAGYPSREGSTTTSTTTASLFAHPNRMRDTLTTPGNAAGETVAATATAAAATTPSSRGAHHQRKMSVPRLGMLQSAQNLASSASATGISPGQARSFSRRENANSVLLASNGDAGDDPASGSVAGSGWRAAIPRLPGSRPPVSLWDVENGESHLRRSREGDKGAGAGDGELKGLKATASATATSFKRAFGNLPGPKQILQGEKQLYRKAEGRHGSCIPTPLRVRRRLVVCWVGTSCWICVVIVLSACLDSRNCSYHRIHASGKESKRNSQDS